MFEKELQPYEPYEDENGDEDGNRDSAFYHFEKAESFFEKQKWGKAEKSYRESIQAFATASAWLKLGLCLIHLDKLPEAEKALRSGIAFVKEHPTPTRGEFLPPLISELSFVLFKNKQLITAKRELELGLKISPEPFTEGKMLSTLGKVNIGLGLYTKGMRSLFEANKILSEFDSMEIHAQNLYYLGIAFFKTNKLKRAKDFFSYSRDLYEIDKKKFKKELRNIRIQLRKIKRLSS